MNREKLRGKMFERGISAKELSEMSGIKYPTLMNKLNTPSDPTLSQVRSISKALGLTDAEIIAIFFD